MELAAALYRFYPQQWQLDKMTELLMNQQALADLKSGLDPRRIAENYHDELEKFEKVRAKYLIY